MPQRPAPTPPDGRAGFSAQQQRSVALAPTSLQNLTQENDSSATHFMNKPGVIKGYSHQRGRALSQPQQPQHGAFKFSLARVTYSGADGM